MDLGIYLKGDQGVVVGDEGLIEQLLHRLDVDPRTAAKTGRGMADLAAGATGVGAAGMSFSGNWFQMTSDSYSKFQELAEFNQTTGGIISGVLRQDKGRIDSFLQFQRAAGINPAAMSNIAVLSATLALRSAVAQLENVVETMDVKIDQLLTDNRAKALGDVQGVTRVLRRAYRIYERTGRVSDTLWDQIAGHTTALAQADSHALNQIEALTRSLEGKGFGEQVAAAGTIAKDELRRWLVILTVCQLNQTRLETLETIRLQTDGDQSVEAYATDNTTAAEQRNEATCNALQRLANALRSAADVSAFNRSRSPQRSRDLLESAETALVLLHQFAEIYGLKNLELGDVEHEPWARSIKSLALQSVSTLSKSAQSVPKKLTHVREEAVLKKARAIETKRQERASE